MLQDAGYLTLKIGNRLLVMHVQYFAWQNLIPVIHRQAILFVVLRQIKEVIGEILTVTEQLLVISKTSIKRVASRINDFRIWQNKVKLSDEGEIVG